MVVRQTCLLTKAISIVAEAGINCCCFGLHFLDFCTFFVDMYVCVCPIVNNSGAAKATMQQIFQVVRPCVH